MNYLKDETRIGWLKTNDDTLSFVSTSTARGFIAIAQSDITGKVYMFQALSEETAIEFLARKLKATIYFI
jgi:hypothetical protein